MPSYTTTGSAYYEVHDNADRPWVLRIDAEYEVWISPWQTLDKGEMPEIKPKLSHVRLFRRFEDDGPWHSVPWDFLNPAHWDPVTALAHHDCREEAVNFALMGWDYDRDRTLEASRA